MFLYGEVLSFVRESYASQSVLVANVCRTRVIVPLIAALPPRTRRVMSIVRAVVFCCLDIAMMARTGSSYTDHSGEPYFSHLYCETAVNRTNFMILYDMHKENTYT